VWLQGDNQDFDPEVSGYVFWPIMFGMAAALQQLVIRL
jgi:hypothetical protein